MSTAVLATLAEAKAHIRIESTTSVDVPLQLALDGAEAWLATRCQTQFTTGSIIVPLHGGVRTLRPIIFPVVSVTEVKDMIGDEVIDSADYRIIADDVGVVWGAIGEAPSSWTPGPYRWQLTYVGGFNDGDESNPDDSTSSI